MAYAQRLERDADVGVKEAFKVLHQGLSCLAGQITATDSHSAQIAALLTSNWEQLARRLSDIRLDVDETHRVLDARLSIAEKAADYSSSALDHALEKIEAFARQRAMDQAENQRQSNRQEQALERLSDAFLKLEKRLPDANITQRLEVVEQALGGMTRPENSTAPLLSALQAVSHRLEALEKDHGDLLLELRARMFEAAPQPAMPQPVERIELPLLVEPPVVEADTGAAPDFEDLFAEAQPRPLNFLTRARMATRVTPETPKPRYLFPTAVGLVIVLALAAGPELHRRVETAVVAKPGTAKADLAGPTYSVPAPPSAEDTQFVVAPDAATDPNTFAAPQPDSRDSAPAPLKPHTVRTAPVKPVPASAKAASTAPPVDKVTQLANAGNPNALTILGLRALDGIGGVAVNLPDAVKYLSAAAEKGQAVAQYRLGTLYERGQGVTVDPVKASHWYELSANQGNRKAMHNLAVSYASRKNMADAARWFAKASALGLSDSEFNLAVLYERGDGVPQSLVDAFKWYSIAAAAGDVESKARVGVLQTQLNDADKATAAKEIEAFHPLPFDHTANVPPEADQLPAS
jgi:localization factor PodJL